MANIIDYLDWYGDFGFDAVPFNEVDNLVLAQLCYLDLSEAVPPLPEAADETAPAGVAFDRCGVSVAEAARAFRTSHAAADGEDEGPLVTKRSVQPLQRMASTGRRFGRVRLGCYRHVFDEPAHEQFAAVTAQLPDGSHYVSFEGTDGTLVGWLEDCEMSYRVVGAQEDALRYLERVADLVEGPLRVGGHSKGGNLAAYAAAFCRKDVQDRIVQVWCNDSPGFVDAVVPLGAFEPIRARMRLYTPEYSVVGALFDQPVSPVVVRSAGAGVMEHSAMTWQVMRGSFVRGDGPSEGSRRVGAVFDQLIGSHDLPGRKKLLDGLYEGLTAAGVTEVAQMFEDGAAGIAKMLGSVNGLEPDDRQSMVDFLSGLLASNLADAVEPLAQQIREALEPAARQMAQRFPDRHLASPGQAGIPWRR